MEYVGCMLYLCKTFGTLQCKLFLFLLFLACHKNPIDFYRLESLNCFVLYSTTWLQVEESLTTEFDLLKRCIWHFQTSVGTSRSVNFPIRNVVVFSDSIVRVKSRWRCQHPFVQPCVDVLGNICVCWDMLL